MVERRFLPLSDEWDEHAPGAFTWVQAWYATQCNGEWEESYGTKIETLDNLVRRSRSTWPARVGPT